MEECIAVLEFYGGAVSYADYWAMPGGDRRALVDHLLRRAREQERAARKARQR